MKNQYKNLNEYSSFYRNPIRKISTLSKSQSDHSLPKIRNTTSLMKLSNMRDIPRINHRQQAFQFQSKKLSDAWILPSNNKKGNIYSVL